MRKSLIPAIVSMLGMSGFSGVATDIERTSKAVSNRWYSPNWFKFPRSRKTVTAAFLKRAAKKRNNIKARSKK